MEIPFERSGVAPTASAVSNRIETAVSFVLFNFLILRALRVSVVNPPYLRRESGGGAGAVPW